MFVECTAKLLLTIYLIKLKTNDQINEFQINQITFVSGAHWVCSSRLTDAHERGASGWGGASARTSEARAIGRMGGRVGRRDADRGLRGRRLLRKDRVESGHSGLCARIGERLRAAREGSRHSKYFAFTALIFRCPHTRKERVRVSPQNNITLYF